VATGQQPLSIMILGSTMAVQFTHYWAQYESSRGLLIATALLLSALITGFRFHNLAMASWLKNPLLICSRYSLEIYFFHLTALKLYHLAQGASSRQTIRRDQQYYRHCPEKRRGENVKRPPLRSMWTLRPVFTSRQ
jgi:hypothetical protein